MPRKKDKSRRCRRPGCSRAATFDSPNDLCGKHWKLWCHWGTKGANRKKPGWLIKMLTRGRDLSYLLRDDDVEDP